jgi:hypothetical protein
MQTQSNLPSLSKILKKMGARELEVFESNLPHSNLQSWTRHLVRMIGRARGYQDRWKLILIAPGLFVGFEVGMLY